MGLFGPKYYTAIGGKTKDIEVAIQSFIKMYELEIYMLRKMSDKYAIPPRFMAEVEEVLDSLRMTSIHAGNRQATLNLCVMMLAALLRNVISLDALPDSEKVSFKSGLNMLKTYYNLD